MVDKQFPKQKLQFSKKTEDWAIKCIEGGYELAVNNLPNIRQDYINKKKNYDLYNDVMDMKDVAGVLSPTGINLSSFPATMQNYPLINPKIKLLLGEEMKRRFEWRIVCMNPDNFSIKEEKMKESITKYVTEAIQSGESDQEVIKRRLSEIKKYYNYDYQDIREKISSDIMKFYFEEQEMKRKFNEGFLDALISSDEIYRVDVVAGEPKLFKCDPLRVWAYGNGLSPYLDDAEIIVEDVYASLGQVQDEFYEDLTEDDVKKLEEQCKYIKGTPNGGTLGDVNYNFRLPTIYTSAFTNEPQSWEINRHNSTGHFFDNNGNVRVIRVTWKSKRKKGILKYYDEQGVPQKTIVDENYVIDETKGEEVKWIWTNEYWEGVRIGKDIYKRMRPKPIQFNSVNNLSSCKSGYVGTYYNTNSSKARSLFDQLKPFQYLYNIFMYRTELAFAKYKGSTIVLPTSLIPNNYDTEKWISMSETLGYLLINPFNEIMEGPNKGELAAQANQFQPSILSDDSVANYIRSNIEMLAYVEEQVGNISGVSKQRQGQISTTELVGNTERAVTQSSHITEPWFTTHENTKLRAMQVFLEAAKYCIKNKTDKRYFHILDEFCIKTLESEPQSISDEDLAIFITSSSKYIEFEQAIKQLAHAAMQNGMIGFKEIIDIYQANSITDMAKIMENAEELKRQQQEAMEKAQRQHEQEMLQQQMALEKQRLENEIQDREDKQMHELAMIKIQAEEDRKTAILEAQLTNNPQLATEELNIKVYEINEKLNLEKEKAEREQRRKDEEHEAKKNSDKEKLKIEKEKANKDNKNKEKELSHYKEIEEKYLDLEEEIKMKELEFQKQKLAVETKLKENEHKLDMKMKEKELELQLKLKAKESEAKQKATVIAAKNKPKTNK